MATENATWGYTRIQGALKNLGHCVGRSTIARILKEQAIPPSGRRPMAWRTFIGAHCPALLASNLFTSLAGALRGLVIHSMALLPELRTRGGQPYTSPGLPDNGFLRQAIGRSRADPRRTYDHAAGFALGRSTWRVGAN